MLKVVWRPRARLDRESIGIFLSIEKQNARAAFKIDQKIEKAKKLLREFPDMGGSLRPDGLNREYRTMPVDPYTIYYTYDENELTIHRILHQRQDIDTYAFVEF